MLKANEKFASHGHQFLELGNPATMMMLKHYPDINKQTKKKHQNVDENQFLIVKLKTH